MTAKVFGFGHAPDRERHHFVVTIGRAGTDVQVHEVFHQDEHGPQLDSVNFRSALSWDRWLGIQDFVSDEFNRRLQDQKLKPARWKTGINPVSRLLGKELVLLAWAIEDADPAQTEKAIANWRGLAPEERWWLYTMTAAQTGHALQGRNRGWRKALQFALCENPVVPMLAPAPPPERKEILKPARGAARDTAKQQTLWRGKLIPNPGVLVPC